MPLAPKTPARPLIRMGAAAQNALEVARFGGLATDEEASPFEAHAAAPQRAVALALTSGIR